MHQPTVVIISDQAGFARDIVSHWQLERLVPVFTMLSSEIWESSGSTPCDLAIVGAGQIPGPRLALLLRSLESQGAACLCVVENSTAFQRIRAEHPRVLAVKQDEDWLDSLVVLAAEILRRADAVARLRRAEQALVAQQRQAALGRFMLDLRHGFNNALTAVLGNAELLQMDADRLPEAMREQVETIHGMALRLHEMMQRFSSLEAELAMEDREPRGSPQAPAMAYLQGTLRENGPGH
jgi:signal transduction histidine kinase